MENKEELSHGDYASGEGRDKLNWYLGHTLQDASIVREWGRKFVL